MFIMFLLGVSGLLMFPVNFNFGEPVVVSQDKDNEVAQIVADANIYSIRKTRLAHLFDSQTLPYFIGPKKITASEYANEIEEKEDLLDIGNGVDDNLYKLIGMTKADADKRSQVWGYNSAKEMFLSIYKSVYSGTVTDIFKLERALRNMNPKAEQLTAEKVYKEADRIISVIFGDYIKYNGSVSGDVLPWSIHLYDQEIFFTKKDYIPYAFSLILLKAGLSGDK